MVKKNVLTYIKTTSLTPDDRKRIEAVNLAEDTNSNTAQGTPCEIKN